MRKKNKKQQHKEALPYGVVFNDDINLYNGDCLEVMDFLISQNITVEIKSLALAHPKWSLQTLARAVGVSKTSVYNVLNKR